MNKQDITSYSDDELSMLFENDESLYNELQKAVRRNDFTHLTSICEEFFIYTPDQLNELQNTFDEERLEYEKD